MSVFLLKIIAVITMLIDHIGYAFYDYIGETNATLMRSIGRFALPIYSFLLAEGYYHIKDDPKKLKDHFIRLVIIALLSEMPYDLIFYRDYYYVNGQSVMLTLLFGMFGLIVIDRLKDKTYLIVFLVLIMLQVSYCSNPDYKVSGVVLIFMLYYYLTKFRGSSFLTKYLALTVISFVFLLFFNYLRLNVSSFGALISKSLEEWYLLVPFIGINILLALYNGQNGYKNKILNSCYAYFYPVHLMVIVAVLVMLGEFDL